MRDAMIIYFKIRERSMLKNLVILFILQLLISSKLMANDKLNIFACEPEWKSLVEEIGGDKVEVFSATHAMQDPHHIRARPSLISKIRRADLIFCSGAGLEVGWMPLLLQKAKKVVQPGKLGYFMAANYSPVIDIPETINRSHGDVHPEGNPHVHLNPHNIMLIAKELNRRLSSIDKNNKSYYQEQYLNFTSKWKKSLSLWEKEISLLKGKKVIVHHKSFSYFLDWLNLEEIASLEVKPGIPPTASHLRSILEKVKNNPAYLIIRSPYDSSEASIWLSKKTKIPAVVLPYTIGGNEESNNLFELFDSSIKIIQQAIYDKY
jgi:zinc/manganese transport system substrate-binding protein